MDDDGLYLPEIRPHSLEKIRRHDYYAALFSKAMAKKWPRRAYMGLYAGAGRARVKGTGEIVETSALNVLRQEVPFIDYIFLDKDPRCGVDDGPEQGERPRRTGPRGCHGRRWARRIYRNVSAP
jgi:hypothetical protein